MNTKQFKYSLYRGSKKWKCPACGQKTAVVYKDNESGELLPDHVSRCDRESNCGYHYSPKQYFSENGEQKMNTVQAVARVEHIEQPVSFIPDEYLERSINPNLYNKNNLFIFLSSLFTQPVALEVCEKYFIGTSNHWPGATVYWQVDKDINARQCKIMLYDALSGKRAKDKAAYYKGKDLIGFDKRLELCFFGEHLLNFPENRNKPVCVVESEKTALIASIYLPQFVWLATGGASGCKWREYAVYKVLKARTVTFFPDHGYYNKKTGKTCYEEWCERVQRISEVLHSKIRVSDVLEKRLNSLDRLDQDLADLLITKDEQTGLALTDAGYPVIWDYKD